MQNHRKNGWMLVEIVFVLGVVTIVISNFFLLNVLSITNNTISKNHVRATRLVQERMKTMLDIYEKKMDKRVVIDGQFYNWSELFDKKVAFPSCVDLLDPASNCSDFMLSLCPSETHPVGTRCVVRNRNAYNTDSWKIKQDVAPFSQKIRMSDIGANAKKITVLIWWIDSLGLHKSVIARTLEK